MADLPDMDTAYEEWRKAPSPQGMQQLLQTADSVINTAVKSYAAGEPSLHGRAKVLAAGAFKSYDPTKGAKLRTHLMTQMQPLRRVYTRRQQPIHVPDRIRSEYYHMNQAEQEFKDSHGRDPSAPELADMTGLSARRLAHIRRNIRPVTAESGMTTRTEEGEEEIFYPGTQQVDPQRVWMDYVHHDLAPIDRNILEWRTGLYGSPVLSNNEIAKRLKLSPGAVSQRAARISGLLAAGRGVEA